MTLEEQIIPHARYWDCYNDEPEKYNHTGKILKIADEFTIGFAEWIDSDFYQGDDANQYHKSILEYREGKIFTVKELLEIYKKEKQL